MFRPRGFVALLVLALVALIMTGCSDGSSNSEKTAQAAVATSTATRGPIYVPHNNVEFNNFNDQQKLADDPSTILWCSVLQQSSTAPVITIPIAGKLTSSTTSVLNPESVHNGAGNTEDVLPATSVDGLYHVGAPPYRFGFTPGHQYVEFFNLPTLCTTQPLEVQRQSVSVKVDSSLNDATRRASEALARGDDQQAQQILETAASG